MARQQYFEKRGVTDISIFQVDRLPSTLSRTLGRANTMHCRPILVFSIVALLLLTGCSRPRDAVIPSDPSKWSQLQDDTKDLGAEDRRLLGAYLMRNSLRSALTHDAVAIPPGTTIGNAIDDQKDFEAKAATEEAAAAVLKAKALAERNAAIDKLNHIVTFAVVSKTYVPKDIYASRFSDRVNFVFAIENNTDKNIAGVKGVVEFDDMFGSLIENIRLSIDEGVQAHRTVSLSNYGKDLNQFEQDDTKLAITDLSKMKVKFIPEMIVFSDGTSTRAPDAPD